MQLRRLYGSKVSENTGLKSSTAIGRYFRNNFGNQKVQTDS